VAVCRVIRRFWSYLFYKSLFCSLHARLP
jgi:hypothetical protein